MPFMTIHPQGRSLNELPRNPFLDSKHGGLRKPVRLSNKNILSLTSKGNSKFSKAIVRGGGERLEKNHPPLFPLQTEYDYPKDSAQSKVGEQHFQNYPHFP